MSRRFQPLPLHRPVTELHGVGNVTARHLASLGITSVEDMLWHFPFRYDDFRSYAAIQDLRLNQQATVGGVVTSITSRKARHRRMTITEALVRDDTGSLQVVWFNQPFLEQTLRAGTHVILSGRLQRYNDAPQMVAPAYEKREPGEETIHVGRLVPIYPTTAGLTQRQMRYFVQQALPSIRYVDDPVPQHIARNESLMGYGEAVQSIHFPRDERERDKALTRLKFNELFVFHITNLRVRNKKNKLGRAPRIRFSKTVVEQFKANLPFKLTAGQRSVAWSILQDMNSATPMNRLLEGDVGSGKTVVAALAAHHASTAGFSTLIMAPTEVLARQHYFALSTLFTDSVPVLLLTRSFAAIGSNTKATRSAVVRKIAATNGAVIIGTHALLRNDVTPKKVGLTVIDEQQRFGVEQRQRLRTTTKQETPHYLALTATPIPRSLALTLFGEMDVSQLKEIPQGRQPITTHVVSDDERAAVYKYVRTELSAGRQAFVVAPLIEPSDRLGVASATALSASLTSEFTHFSLGLLHGRLSAQEKERVIHDFAHGRIDVLVTTPVVEVGIDVPNATVMIIEAAERFGMSQLHQLRGRVGRGTHPSRCYFVSGNVTPLSARRLQAVAASHDGFRIAQRDLELRGPGDLVGTVQSGLLDFRFTNLGDEKLIQHTRELARQLLQKDPHLEQCPHLQLTTKDARLSHLE